MTAAVLVLVALAATTVALCLDPLRQRDRVQKLSVEAVEVPEGRETRGTPRKERAEAAERREREQPANPLPAHFRVRRIAASTISG